MASLESPSPVPAVPVEEQFIVGWGNSTFDGDADAARQRVDAALSTLLDDLPATLLKEFIGIANDKAYCAFALIRLDGPDRTLEHLKHEVASGKEKDKSGYAHIEWVEANAPIALAQFNDPLSASLSQWALPHIGVTQPWTVAPPPGTTIVAIVDSGLSLPGGGLHADLNPIRVVPAANSQPPFFYVDNVDRHGHGNLLAGTIAAWTDNNVGIASAVHPGWDIRIMAVKFFEPPLNPTAFDAAVAMAWVGLHVLLGNPVKVINASWHVPVGDPNLFTLGWVTTFVTALGCVVVFSAGNDGTDNQIYPLFPANFTTNVLLQGRVMAVLATDHHDNKASFSNYSPVSVNIGAPGIHVLTTGRYLVPPPRYSRYNGTSAAAAHVSAGAALVAALNPGWGPGQVVQHVLASADQIPQLMVACVNGRRLNLANAVYGPVRMVAPPPPAAPAPPPVVLPAAAVFNITWAVSYNNPAFAQVSIEFVTQAGAAFPIAIVPIGPPGVGGVFPWTPNANPLPPLPAIGTVRITPVGGNFPVHSAAVQIN